MKFGDFVLQEKMIEDRWKALEAKEAEVNEMHEELSGKINRKQELQRYIGLLGGIPETCGRYMHEMNDAVSELHGIMGFRKHTKG